MTTFSSDQINKAFNESPQEVQDLILSIEIVDKFQNIANKYRLSREQKNKMSEETTYLLLNLLDEPSFINNLSQNLSIPLGIASDIHNDIVKHVINAEDIQEHETDEESTQNTTFKDQMFTQGGIELEKSDLETKDTDTMEEKSQILGGIENPARSTARYSHNTSIVDNKLQSLTNIPRVVTRVKDSTL